MILLSYDAVIKGFNLGLNMFCVTANRHTNREIFDNAKNLWFIKDFSKIKKHPYQIDYGPVGKKVYLRFDHLLNMENKSWKGFRGVFLFHPELQDFRLFSPREREILIEIDHANTRYQDQWHH